MVHSSFFNHALVFLTIASIFSTFSEANRGFGWGWGTNYSTGSGSRSGWGWDEGSNNYTSGSGSTPGFRWGWGSSRNGSSWGWGWGWGGIPNNTHNSGSGDSGWGPNQNNSNWGWGRGPNNNHSSGPGGFGPGSGWGWGGHSKNYNVTYNGPRKIIVGGDKEWTYGFNYADWASKTAPFFLNDILVFKYNPPAPFTHSVYLLPNPSSYEKCEVKKGKMIASPKQGAGDGFELVLKKLQPYFISCGEHDGAHCSNGTMKFTVFPILPRW